MMNIGNSARYRVINGHFSNFFSHIVYGKGTIEMVKSSFNKVLDTCIYMEKSIHITVYNDYSANTTVNIVDVLFSNVFTSNKIAGAIYCNNAQASFYLISSLFTNCTSGKSENFANRGSVSSGAFVFYGKNAVLESNCFLECTGVGYCFVYLIYSTQIHQINMTSIMNCGKKYNPGFSFLSDYGNQIYSYMNSSHNVGNDACVSGVPGSYGSLGGISFFNLVNNSGGLSIFGLGFSSNTITAHSFNVVNNAPTTSIFMMWGNNFIFQNIIFIGNTNKVYAPVPYGSNGALTLQYCYSDTNYLGGCTIGTNVFSHVATLTKLEINIVNKCVDLIKLNTRAFSMRRTPIIFVLFYTQIL